MLYALKSLVANPGYVIGPFKSKADADAYVRERLIGPYEVVLFFPPRKEIGQEDGQDG